MRDASPTGSQGGFSLLEALISLTIFLAVLVAVLSTYTPSKKIYMRGSRKAEVQQHARLAMAEMTRRIRMAGYFPENFTSPPPGTLQANGIRAATNSALAIYGDASNAGASNVFLFCRDGSRVRMLQGSAAAAGSYNCTSGNIMAENVTDLRFVYYDASGNPLPSPPTVPYQLDSVNVNGALPSLTTTTQRASVRRVLVALTTQMQAPDKMQTFTLTSDVWLRNMQ